MAAKKKKKETEIKQQWLSRLPPADQLAIISTHSAQKSLARVELSKIEEDLYRTSCDVVFAACDFAELDPADPDAVPIKWIQAYGEHEAVKRHRIARYAMLPATLAPMGMRVAVSVAAGIMRVRSGKTPIDVHQNVALVTLPKPKKYEEMEIIEDGEGIPSPNNK